MDGRNEPVANATTYAEKDQRKAIPMKALWRLGVGTGVARQRDVATYDAHARRFLTESRPVYFFHGGQA